MPEQQNNIDVWRGKVTAHLEHISTETQDIKTLVKQQEEHCERYRGVLGTNVNGLNSRISKLENQRTSAKAGFGFFWGILTVVGTAFCMALAMWLFKLI